MPSFTADIAIIGSGFAGSVMALVLNRLGRSCVVIDRQQHPRFAIGESSTPLADMALRDIARKFELPRLAPLSKYGSWMATYPQVMRGLKRGFSYFQHNPGKPFVPNAGHTNELLVAASTDNVNSDTHWLRSDVDAFFAGEVRSADVPLLENTVLTRLENARGEWQLQGACRDEPVSVRAKFLIDGSGDGKVLAHTLGLRDETNLLKTNSRPLFAHFAELRPWRQMLVEKGASLADHPFDCDRSAQHQVLDGAWMWQLRFDSEVTSAGFAIASGRHPLDETLSAQDEWDLWMSRYPSLRDQFAQARIVDPPRGLTRGGRMQRLLAPMAGPNWVLLPHTAGFIDPLQSSGIAHSLFGIERLGDIFERHWGKGSLPDALQEYGRIIRTEIELIDILIDGLYKGMADFRLFAAVCMLYFAGTVACERRRAGAGFHPERHFLNADDQSYRQAARFGYDRMGELVATGQPTKAAICDYENLIRDLISPWNTANLMNPAAKNMYRHTAARK